MSLKYGVAHGVFMPYAKHFLSKITKEKQPKEKEKYARIVTKIGEWDRNIASMEDSEVGDD